MRWLFHVMPRVQLDAWAARTAAWYAPPSLASEGFIHASYKPAVLESARLYFSPDETLVVLQIDPRRLHVPVKDAATPRGPMPHVHGAIPRGAIMAVLALSDVEHAADEVLEPRRR